MALDQVILEETGAGRVPPTIRFLQFSPSAALCGYHQDVDLEIRTDYCRDHGIDINRRLTGGGGIFFQESALGWEIFGAAGEPPFQGAFETILTRICSIAADGLSRLGVEARFRPRNDIEIAGRKVSGTGGVTAGGAFMFQGTVLVQNEVEQFLKALRVPVEKLKKREIESLLDRICFLSDLVDPPPGPDTVKAALAKSFEESLGVRLEAGDLTETERNRLKEELPYFQSDAWIRRRSRPQREGTPARTIHQTDAGTMRVHLWASPGGTRVARALVAGDFFCAPQRIVNDLESALVGVPMRRSALDRAVLDFFDDAEGEILGIAPETVACAVGEAAERFGLWRDRFSLDEINELFFVNMRPGEETAFTPNRLLLPYCSKALWCEYRNVPGCAECGGCEIGTMCEIARDLGMKPLTVQSFEHLMEVLETECLEKGSMYVGSCCEAFYAKHRKEMEAVGARGLLVNLDSTTCYDLGKGTMAYKGHFDVKTRMNLDLIEKTLKRLHGISS
jgi:lipoate-protein ligase A